MITYRELINNAKKNIEQILSEICEKKVILKLKYRNLGNSRLSICEEATNNNTKNTRFHNTDTTTKIMPNPELQIANRLYFSQQGTGCYL